MRKMFIFLAFVMISTSASADFYLRPRAGAIIPVNGNDVSYTFGAALGYQWTSLLATEIDYARVLGTSGNPDGDLVSAQAIVSIPLAVITPYASAGVGTSHYSLGTVSEWDMMYLLGAGLTFDLIPFLTLGAGVNYAFVQDQPDFFQPVITAALKF